MNATHRAGWKSLWRELVDQQTCVLFFLAFFILSALFVPKFANVENLANIAVQSSELIIMACGLTFVFLNGGIDFSMTAVLALCSVIGAKIMTCLENETLGVILGLLAMLITALVIGCINGLSVTRLKMPSFIATMATQLVFAGVALTMTQSKTIGGVPQAFNQIAQGSFLGADIPVYITLVVVAVCLYLFHFSTYGKRVLAVGTNHKASAISGLNVKGTIFSLFVISSLCSVVSCIIMSARLGAGVPALGKDMLMDVVAAVVIGGTSVSGGKGSIIGSVIGAVLVVMLNNSLNLLGIDWYYIMACKGAVILLVTLLAVMREKAS